MVEIARLVFAIVLTFRVDRGSDVAFDSFAKFKGKNMKALGRKRADVNIWNEVQ